MICCFYRTLIVTYVANGLWKQDLLLSGNMELVYRHIWKTSSDLGLSLISCTRRFQKDWNRSELHPWSSRIWAHWLSHRKHCTPLTIVCFFSKSYTTHQNSAWQNAEFLNTLMAAIAQSVQWLIRGSTIRGSKPNDGEVFHIRPEWSWFPPSLLHKGYRIIVGSKVNRRGVSTNPHIQTKLKKEYS
jgi:hypothetical protein